MPAEITLYGARYRVTGRDWRRVGRAADPALAAADLRMLRLVAHPDNLPGMTYFPDLDLALATLAVERLGAELVYVSPPAPTPPGVVF